ncbi:MAG: V-type ATP synthase subunit B, partial [Anaerolineae bacterium]|nr:V-type ATP synthase subunit B [Anaerolineae bacterium]
MKSKSGAHLSSTYLTDLVEIRGPLLIFKSVGEVAYHELVEIHDPAGGTRLGRVIAADQTYCLVQVFVGTAGLDLHHTRVRFLGETGTLGVSLAMLGRMFNGTGVPIDGKAPILTHDFRDLNGLPINPVVRAEPDEFIQTGISAIDGLNTLARGQKLPIFTGSGLPGNELAAQIAIHSSVRSGDRRNRESFAVVFAAMGITHREADFYIHQFESVGSLSRSVIFLNLANDPTIERLMTPRMALTTAEYLAFTQHRHVLVILTDMTNYCEALREVSIAREELPGRRGFPGNMYSELASLYERAGRINAQDGSVTQLILLTMPDDDITHPIADLTGYITEGQIVLSRALHQKGIYPPIDVLPSLSRLMNAAIGEGKTRADHRVLADQLYSLYAQGNDLRQLVAIVGEGALSKEESQVLAFANNFELQFIHQNKSSRTVEETLSLAWSLLREVPRSMLKRI